MIILDIDDPYRYTLSVDEKTGFLNLTHESGQVFSLSGTETVLCLIANMFSSRVPEMNAEVWNDGENTFISVSRVGRVGRRSRWTKSA